jgi:hypothetical protein
LGGPTAMSKKIYVGRRVDEVSRKTGIPVETLKQAEAGKIELTAAQKRRLDQALGGRSIVGENG